MKHENIHLVALFIFFNSFWIDPTTPISWHLFNISNSQPIHTDLNDEKVSKKSLLRQNGLHLNKKGLEFIFKYSPSPFLSPF